MFSLITSAGDPPINRFSRLPTDLVRAEVIRLRKAMTLPVGTRPPLRMAVSAAIQTLLPTAIDGSTSFLVPLIQCPVPSIAVKSHPMSTSSPNTIPWLNKIFPFLLIEKLSPKQAAPPSILREFPVAKFALPLNSRRAFFPTMKYPRPRDCTPLDPPKPNLTASLIPDLILILPRMSQEQL